jgi:hypothetical protein
VIVRPGASRRAAATPSLRPRDGGRELPPWSPTPPRTGWTTTAIFQTALDYAQSLAGRSDVPSERRLVLVAYGELLRAAGLQRVDIMERLRGEGQVDTYLGVTPGTEPVDDEDDDAPPF